MFYNSKHQGQYIEQKLDELQNVSITQDEFKYLENDIYHAGNRGDIFPTSHSLILSNTKNKQTIRVDGDKNTFYPVHIHFF